MVLDPVVIKIPVPAVSPTGGRFRGLLDKLHLPNFEIRTTKIITAIAAIVIAVTMTSFVIFSMLSNNKSFTEKHGLDVNKQTQVAQTTGARKSDASLPGGGTATGVGGGSGTNIPVITLTATPASVELGGTINLKWSVTKTPKSCVASDDWSGAKAASGSETSSPLTKVQVYLFTITCKTDTGTGYSTVSVSATAPNSSTTAVPVGAPVVSIAAVPSSIYASDYSTITWSATNSPTSCTASGDWSGTKSGSGSQSTGALTTIKTYSFTLVCSNASGSSAPKTAQVLVREPPANVPIVTLASNPVGPVVPGSSITLTWNTTNSPTSCVATGDWSGSKAASGSQVITGLSTIKTYSFTIDCSNSAGGTNDTAAVQVIPDPPAVSLTVSPSSMYVGSSSTITWSATNSPTSCVASGDWAGAKAGSGTVSTGTLNTAKTYLYSLSCVNAGGTGYTNNVALVVSLPPAPVVTISANPISVTSGSSSTITWSATNSPTSCVASGDWAGAKASSGTAGTGTLSTIKTYSYVLGCSNAGGSGSATTTVNVSAGGGGVVAPVVSISASPNSIGTGSSSTITWSATNNPTSCTASNAWSGSKSGSGSSGSGVMASAGTYTYTLSCSNSAGSGSASATLTVIALPVVTISVSPSSINTGSSSTITWSATNSPTSCTAGGSWSGTKAASGSQTTGTVSTAGSYTYSLSCTNAGGTASNSTTLTVSNPAPVYCSGLTPCYGPSDLALHASAGNCWGWNLTWVVNITSFRPNHLGGIKSGSTSTLENATVTCNHNIHTILTGSAGITGYKDSSGATTHSHASSTTNNTGSSALAAYRVGYYDATKP